MLSTLPGSSLVSVRLSLPAVRPAQIELVQLVAHNLRAPLGRAVADELVVEKLQPAAIDFFRLRRGMRHGLGRSSRRVCHMHWTINQQPRRTQRLSTRLRTHLAARRRIRSQDEPTACAEFARRTLSSEQESQARPCVHLLRLVVKRRALRRLHRPEENQACPDSAKHVPVASDRPLSRTSEARPPRTQRPPSPPSASMKASPSPCTAGSTTRARAASCCFPSFATAPAPCRA